MLHIFLHMGKSCTADRSAHIPVRRSSGSTAVLWSFPLLQSSRHKQVPVPIRPSPFLTRQVSSARRFSKKKHPQSIPALWMSCGHLDSFLPFFRCLADIRLLWFFILCFCPGFQCDTDTVAFVKWEDTPVLTKTSVYNFPFLPACYHFLTAPFPPCNGYGYTDDHA